MLILRALSCIVILVLAIPVAVLFGLLCIGIAMLEWAEEIRG